MVEGKAKTPFNTDDPLLLGGSETPPQSIRRLEATGLDHRPGRLKTTAKAAAIGKAFDGFAQRVGAVRRRFPPFRTTTA